MNQLEKFFRSLKPWQWAALGGSAFLAYLFWSSKARAQAANRMLTTEELHDATLIPIPPLSQWVRVSEGGRVWLVAPTYLAPVGIGEAFRVAALHGFTVPTPELVDVIWQQADVRVEPHPRSHDGTARTMNSDEMHRSQQAFIASQIEVADPERKGRLFAGMYKDVVLKNGRRGIYGWHRLNGNKIQDFYADHASGDSAGSDYKDYSQGLRLVRRVG